MNITNRLFAYPVLTNERKDYKTSMFSADYNQKMEGINSLRLSFNISMNCKEVETLIGDGMAEYVIHLECTNTAYREVVHSFSKHIEHVIPISRINGVLDLVAFIILKKNIKNLCCTDWVPDFDGMKFDLSQGTMIAYDNLSSLNITKKFDEFANTNSIFSIYKLLNDNVPSEIILDASTIKIGLGDSDYKIYASCATKSELQPILNATIILPALVYVFEELKQDEGIEMYKNREWFMALEKAYAKRSMNFLDEVLNIDKSSYKLAQEIMELPISNALNKIPLLLNEFEEDAI